MALYFITEVVTREGMLTVDEAPGRSKGVVTAAQKFGVTVLEFFFCMNNFDFIMKVEAPDDESVTAFVMSVRKSGNVTATLTRAFTPEEWGGMVARLSA